MNIEQHHQKLIEFDTPTVANGLEMLGVCDPTVGYTGPDVRALMPEMGVRVGIAVTCAHGHDDRRRRQPAQPVSKTGCG